MKNYTLNKVSAKDFVLNYRVINNKIFVSYADGRVDCIPYSASDEKSLLEKMKNQVVSSKYFSNQLNTKFEIFLKLFIDEVLLFVLFVIASFMANIPMIPTAICAVIFPVVIGLTSFKLSGYQKLRNDIKKHWLFLNNEESLNLIIRNNPKITRGLDRKLKGKVLAKESNNFAFTFNTIDKIKYKELQQVYRHVEHVSNKNKSKSLNRVRRRNRNV